MTREKRRNINKIKEFNHCTKKCDAIKNKQTENPSVIYTYMHKICLILPTEE